MKKENIRHSVYASKNSDVFYRPFLIFFLLMNGARVIASYLPDVFLFGLDFYRYLPLRLSLLFIALSFLFLFPSINQKVGNAVLSLGILLYRGGVHIEKIHTVLLLAAGGVCFFFIRVKPYLGDGVSRIQDLGKPYIQTLKDYFDYREYQVLSYFIYNQVSLLLGYCNIESYYTFYIFNVFAGILFLYFVVRLSSAIHDNPLNKITSAIFLVAQAYTILFMGYIEYYSLPLAGSAAYLYFGVHSLRKEFPLWPAAAIVVVLISLHLMSVILFPSFIYLVIIRLPKESRLRRFFSCQYPMTLFFVSFATLSALLFLLPGPFSGLLIDMRSLFQFYNYAPYIIFHLNEVLNLLSMGAGMAIFAMILFRKTFMREIGGDYVLHFFSLNAFFGILLVLFFKPSGNLAADWDIMAIPLLMINLTGIYLLLRYPWNKAKLTQIGIIVSQAAVFFFLWFTVNSYDIAAASRIISIANHSHASGNPQYPVYADGMTFKYYYFIEKDYRKCREIAEVLLENIRDESLWEYIPLLVEMKAPDLGIQFNKKYIEYKEGEIKNKKAEWFDYYNLGRNGYMYMEQYDKAILMFRKALELNPMNNDLHYVLGSNYEYNNQYDEALSEYIIFDSMYSESASLRGVDYYTFLENVYKLFSAENRVEEGIQFFQKNKAKKGSWSDYFIGFLYIAKLDYKTGAEYLYNFLKSGLKRDKTMNLNMAQGFLLSGDFDLSWRLAHESPMPEINTWVMLVDSLKRTEWYRGKYLNSPD